MLTVFGSTAIDTIRTPNKVLKGALGGAATFASISASYFVKPGLIAVAGKVFPKKYHNVLSKYVDLQGFTINEGKKMSFNVNIFSAGKLVGGRVNQSSRRKPSTHGLN